MPEQYFIYNDGSEKNWQNNFTSLKENLTLTAKVFLSDLVLRNEERNGQSKQKKNKQTNK